MKKLLLSIFFVFCSSVSQEQVYETTTTVIDMELTLCEKVEKEYISLSNELFVTSFELKKNDNYLKLWFRKRCPDLYEDTFRPKTKTSL